MFVGDFCFFEMDIPCRQDVSIGLRSLFGGSFPVIRVPPPFWIHLAGFDVKSKTVIITVLYVQY